MMQNEYFLNRQVQMALYALKRQYGGAVTVFHILSATTDPRTGEPSAQYRAWRFGRVVVLPARISRDIERNISIISANKQMVMGGGYDSGKRTFIFDRRDAPNLALAKDDFLVYGGNKYAIETLDEYEFSSAYVVVAKRLVGETFDDSTVAQYLSAEDTVELSSAGEGEV